MTHKLFGQIVSLLRSGLAGAPITNDSDQIVQGLPPTTPRPMVAVYAGNLQLGDMAGDLASSEPRPMSLREEFAISGGNAQGPYILAKTPLDSSALGKLIFDKDGLEERRTLIQEKKDFSIDYPNHSLTLTTDTVGAGHFSVEYSFAGIFFLQDFQQEFFIEVLDENAEAAERLASLSATILFTRHNELIEHFNQTNRTTYTATQYLSEHWIGRFNWKETTTLLSGHHVSLKLRFLVNGQIKHIRENIPGFGIIESIRSAGTPAAAGVNIVPELS